MASKNNKSTEEKDVATRNVQRSPNRISIYADDTQVARNYFGFSIKFNQILHIDTEKGDVYLEEMAVVSMSPEHASAVHRVLGEQLESFVETFGELRQRPALEEGAEAPKSGKQPPGSAYPLPQLWFVCEAFFHPQFAVAQG